MCIWELGGRPLKNIVFFFKKATTKELVMLNSFWERKNQFSLRVHHTPVEGYTTQVCG